MRVPRHQASEIGGEEEMNSFPAIFYAKAPDGGFVVQPPRDARKRWQKDVSSRHQKEEDQIRETSVRCHEINRRLQYPEDTERLCKTRDDGMRQGNAPADSECRQVFSFQ
jgi:hypothetical protein